MSEPDVDRGRLQKIPNILRIWKSPNVIFTPYPKGGRTSRCEQKTKGGGSKREPPSIEEEEEEKGSVWEQACFEQCRSVPSRSQSNIYRMQLRTPGGMQPKLVVEAPCAFDDGQIRWGREARRALFGKKMPAAANIDSVAVNGADGLRSQWREGVNTKHHMRGLFLTKCQWPSNSESQETFTPLLYSHKPLTKNNPLL